jgi:LysR family glycine cleavage system transcriptional activator
MKTEANTAYIFGDRAQPARNLPPFAALRAFEAVGRSGGQLRKAALALNLDHAVVSRHIRALEAWVGAPLIHRERGTVGLTPQGLSYHARISAAILEISDATASLAPPSNVGRLIIWSNGGFTAHWLNEQVDQFSSLNPNIEIELHPTDIAPNLLHGEADVDIRFYLDKYHELPSAKGITYTLLGKPPFLAVASPKVAAALADLESVSELLSEPLIHEENDEQWKAWFTAHGVAVPERLPGARLWHAHLALAAARRGQGIALGNGFLVDEDLRTGRLVALPLGPRCSASVNAIIGGYYFVAREDRWRSPLLAKFRRIIQRAVATHN